MYLLCLAFAGVKIKLLERSQLLEKQEGTESDPELSSNKDWRLREVKCLPQGHTATHLQSRKHRRCSVGCYQSQGQRPPSPAPPEQTAELQRENSPPTHTLPGEFAEAASPHRWHASGVGGACFLERVSSKNRRTQQALPGRQEGVVVKQGPSVPRGLRLRLCHLLCELGPVTTPL